MAKKWTSPKDPDDISDWKINWSSRLAEGETITASTWVVPDGLTEDDSEFDDTSTTIWLSGGVAGTSYDLVNRVTTSDTRQYDQTGRLKVKEL